MRVFYSIYAKKIIEMEMGLIEMYNIKVIFKYSYHRVRMFMV